MDGSGQVKIRLSEASGDVLTKAGALKRWQVQPPMTRGAKAAQTSDNKDTGKPSTTAKPKQKTGKPINLHVKQARAQKKANSKPKIAVADLSASSIRRTTEGRDAVKTVMNALMEVDDEIFSQAPSFDTEGNCRLKFENASDFTREKLLENAPGCFEDLYLVCIL